MIIGVISGNQTSVGGGGTTVSGRVELLSNTSTNKFTLQPESECKILSQDDDRRFEDDTLKLA